MMLVFTAFIGMSPMTIVPAIVMTTALIVGVYFRNRRTEVGIAPRVDWDRAGWLSVVSFPEYGPSEPGLANRCVPAAGDPAALHSQTGSQERRLLGKQTSVDE
jgi:hypothetical protein